MRWEWDERDEKEKESAKGRVINEIEMGHDVEIIGNDDNNDDDNDNDNEWMWWQWSWLINLPFG